MEERVRTGCPRAIVAAMGAAVGRVRSREVLAGRYRLEEIVGTGGMGAVWRAWDLRERRWVALKVLSRYDAPLLLRFVREQGLRIAHPHVATPHAWVAEDERVALAMELARAGTVAELLAEHGPFPEPFVAELLDQLLQGLTAVHAAGVVHRDLKPANLLLDATGSDRPHLLIGDFGVATALGEPRFTLAPDSVGTPGYADPAQLTGAEPDPRHDLWSVGAIGVELLTGARPHRRPPTPPPGRLLDVLTALLQPEAADRPADATAALLLLRGSGLHWQACGVLVPDRTLASSAAARHRHRRSRDPRSTLWAAAACLAGSLGLSVTTTVHALTGQPRF